MGEQVAASSFERFMEALASILEEKEKLHKRNLRKTSLHKWLLNNQKDLYLENRIQSKS